MYATDWGHGSTPGQVNKGDPIPFILVLERKTAQLFYFLVKAHGEQAAYHLSGHDGLCSSSWALQEFRLLNPVLPLEALCHSSYLGFEGGGGGGGAAVFLSGVLSVRAVESR